MIEEERSIKTRRPKVKRIVVQDPIFESPVTDNPHAGDNIYMIKVFSFVVIGVLLVIFHIVRVSHAYTNGYTQARFDYEHGK